MRKKPTISDKAPTGDDLRKATISDKATTGDDLRPEYRFDYRKAKPNRFAAEAVKGGFVVLVDEDIAEVFQTPESIKDVLRALIATMPPRTSPKSTARRDRS
jgi:hypothetical protein